MGDSLPFEIQTRPRFRRSLFPNLLESHRLGKAPDPCWLRGQLLLPLKSVAGGKTRPFYLSLVGTSCRQSAQWGAEERVLDSASSHAGRMPRKRGKTLWARSRKRIHRRGIRPPASSTIASRSRFARRLPKRSPQKRTRSINVHRVDDPHGAPVAIGSASQS